MADEEQEYYGYYYGDDEDRGLLDTAWENQQKKVCVFVYTLIACIERMSKACIINDIYDFNSCIFYKQ